MACLRRQRSWGCRSVAMVLAGCAAGQVLMPDGTVARPLSEAQMEAMHDRLDSDADGRASLDEFLNLWSKTRQSIAKKAAPDLIAKMDKDKDGKLSLDDVFADEVFAGMDPEKKAVQDHMFHEGQKFMTADTNKDKFLDASEVTNFFFPDTHSGVQEHMADRVLQRHDGDGDGVLSEAEFLKGHKKRTTADFHALDKDDDGQLDKKELKALESGKHEVEQAMSHLIDTADEDGDGHLSKKELTKAREAVATLAAHGHLSSWAKHHEL
eukprot:TRINITY_DN101315_c0_g1_i1.p1 TRINITY_DN101315_c0_g1~~TRINITY_DN101315_c0_g1_i1.p1  ORF type:complete len:267 (+),score=75.61 TRINITY_DN101315_c0_g1_i1:198-998(+)